MHNYKPSNFCYVHYCLLGPYNSALINPLTTGVRAVLVIGVCTNIKKDELRLVNGYGFYFKHQAVVEVQKKKTCFAPLPRA